MAKEKENKPVVRELGCQTQPTTLIPPMPLSDPSKKNMRVWVGEVGDITYMLTPGTYKNDEGKIVDAGLPYGSIARNLLITVFTLAKINGSPRIYLGKSREEAAKILKCRVVTGKNGNCEQIQQAFYSLFLASMTIQRGKSLRKMNIFREFVAWEDAERKGSDEGWVELDHEFFEEQIYKRGFPLDLSAYLSMSRSPLAQDLYGWLCYRMNAPGNRPLAIKWGDLHKQYGKDLGKTFHFKSKAVGAFQDYIFKVWPEMKEATNFKTGHLYIKKIAPHVSREESKKLKFHPDVFSLPDSDPALENQD